MGPAVVAFSYCGSFIASAVQAPVRFTLLRHVNLRLNALTRFTISMAKDWNTRTSTTSDVDPYMAGASERNAMSGSDILPPGMIPRAASP